MRNLGCWALAGLSACSLSFDFDGLSRESDGGGTIRCTGSVCSATDAVCCLDANTGEGTCGPAAACSGVQLPCDEAYDCPRDEICCGWSSGPQAVVACRSKAACAERAGYRFLCERTRAHSCPSELPRCIGTDSLKGFSKCAQ